MARRLRVEVRVPPKIAYLLAKIAMSVGESPATISARLLARGVERMAKELGLEDDWEQVMHVVVEELERHPRGYFSRKAAQRILRAAKEELENPG